MISNNTPSWITSIKAMPKKIVTTSGLLAGRDTIIMNWATQGIIRENWGDKLNPWMAEFISGKPVTHREDVYPITSRPIHYWVGSHLGTACADQNSIIWGAGCISQTVPLKGNPREIDRKSVV